MRGPSEERAQAPDGVTRGVEKQGKRTVAREQMHTRARGHNRVTASGDGNEREARA